MPTQLTPEIIAAAILGFEEQKRNIDIRLAELRGMLNGGSAEAAATPGTATRKRRKMSAAGRKAIAEAQRKRWAAAKEGTETPAAKVAPTSKRKLSAAGKANIVAALKKRWAAKKAKQSLAKKKSASARKPKAAKKTTPVSAQATADAGGQ